MHSKFFGNYVWIVRLKLGRIISSILCNCHLSFGNCSRRWPPLSILLPIMLCDFSLNHTLTQFVTFNLPCVRVYLFNKEYWLENAFFSVNFLTPPNTNYIRSRKIRAAESVKLLRLCSEAAKTSHKASCTVQKTNREIPLWTNSAGFLQQETIQKLHPCESRQSTGTC